MHLNIMVLLKDQVYLQRNLYLELLSTIAIVLLYSGGLQALQNMMIIAALPFSIIIALMTFSLLKALREEAKQLGIGRIKKRKE
ncbi:hypothetical protein A6K24_23000 [Metabacillus litoralis]|uniref:Uncharacterized protein n=1 Tax=Metabacillus litoralis TaxID=152268 RepID=A0A179SXB5_9BACI|nr:hypothetical protein A6K24_23000 [Metabacillus litoralis]